MHCSVLIGHLGISTLLCFAKKGYKALAKQYRDTFTNEQLPLHKTILE